MTHVGLLDELKKAGVGDSASLLRALTRLYDSGELG